MQRVLVVDKSKEPLMPCHPARARQLLKAGRAKVLRRYPFTIQLLEREGGDTQDIEFKTDPGSKTSGIVLVGDFQRGKRVIWAGEIQHRGEAVRDNLLHRRQMRRGRRGRKTRYRQPRFENRKRKPGWIPPSLESRVNNLRTWLKRLCRFAPVTGLAMELAKFDTQLLENPNISGVEYQQGELEEFEVKEYLLLRDNYTYVYCGAKNVPFEKEHIVPKSRGGSNRVSNLVLSCVRCNEKKGNRTAEEFGFPQIQTRTKKPLRDAAAINITRWFIFDMLESTGLPLTTGTGGRTKFNRTRQNYPKAHWLDAACVGETGEAVFVHTDLRPLLIKAVGRQSRQMCRINPYGFPLPDSAKQSRLAYGFQTGDIVKAVVPRGKKQGTHIGRVAIRASGSFRVGKVDGIHHRYCQIIHHADGYEYQQGDVSWS